MAKRRLNAQIVATAVEVHCPHCGEPLPNPLDGSYLWEPYQVAANQGARDCNACDEPFTVMSQSKAQVLS